jgi:hypothetical protein
VGLRPCGRARAVAGGKRRGRAATQLVPASAEARVRRGCGPTVERRRRREGSDVEGQRRREGSGARACLTVAERTREGNREKNHPVPM